MAELETMTGNLNDGTDADWRLFDLSVPSMSSRIEPLGPFHEAGDADGEGIVLRLPRGSCPSTWWKFWCS